MPEPERSSAGLGKGSQLSTNLSGELPECHSCRTWGYQRIEIYYLDMYNTKGERRGPPGTSANALEFPKDSCMYLKPSKHSTTF